MNQWIKHSIDLANQRNYLDLLYKVYPMSNNIRREIPKYAENKIRQYLNEKDNINLLKELLKLEIFPIKDSYVAYFKRDKTAIQRNPNTVNRLMGIIHEMGIDEILEKSSAPKETNRQIGPLFKHWLQKGYLGVPVFTEIEDFMKSSENAILNMADNKMKLFAQEHLGYTHDKGLDFIGRFNNKYIIGEAKFLTDFGGHQNSQFQDAITTMTSNINPNMDLPVIVISILDGVLYIKGKNKIYRQLNTTHKNDNILSCLLLRDFLFSI